MAPKKKAEQEEPPPKEEEKRPSPVWIYGINDHLEGPKALPANFKRGASLREDYVKLSELVGAVAHPALKVKPKVQKLPPIDKRRISKGRTDRGDAKDQSSLNVDMTGAAQWGGRKPSNAGVDKPAENPPPVEESEDPVLSLRSMLLDRISVHLLGLLLPAGHKIKVLIFSDCRLDVEMLRLLRVGFVSGSPVEALQIEWNPLEVPLPTVEDMEAEEKAKAEEALALAAANDDGTTSVANAESVEAEMMPVPAANHHDLEVRERRRYLIQSQRTLRAFKERLADYSGGNLEASFEILEAYGDMEVPLNSADFYGVIEARLGFRGPQVVSVFEVLDGPDYAGSEGTLTLGCLRRALEALPEEVVREGVEDPVGSALAAFVEPDCVLESVSFRASALSRAEFTPIANALKNQPWQLRILNLWDNQLCDRCALKLGEALEVYRGLEYIGLGQNRITDDGLKSVTGPFNLQILGEESLKVAQETIKEQQAKIEAKAKAKAKPAPAHGESVREPRESPLYVDDLKENPAEEEGGDPVWVYRRRSELKTLNLSENPIKNPEIVGHLQIIGPEGTDLVLRGCPVASMMATKRPDVGPKGRRASGYGAIEGSGWVLRLV